MWWLTNIVWVNRRFALTLFAVACVTLNAVAQELRWPADTPAGVALSIASSGSGKARLYLLGPAGAFRREIQLGQDVQISGRDLSTAGKYLAIVCSDTCKTSVFFVVAAAAANLTFLVHPSRVPAGQQDAISGVIFPFDRFHNLVLDPVAVTFKLSDAGSEVMSNTVPSRNGVSWFRANAGSRAGIEDLLASVGPVSARRVVRLVASDPCNLRIKAQPSKSGIAVETEPVRDCAGNQVPDGTIVTFTETASSGKSTVDAPIKQGIARAQMVGGGRAVISVASGVVLGNEVRVSEGQ